MTFAELKRLATVIKDEWREGWNTVTRIGTVFPDIIHKMKEFRTGGGTGFGTGEAVRDAIGRIYAVTGKSVGEAPQDGNTYARRDGQRAGIETENGNFN